ncbi:hypothetical protein Q4E40_08325 [Pontibacter sp. BT731]|uniref:hypothetical protein n=1 Tax=Pontibacter coccineus TaxID=3063328 RepID=UPI0026E17305|nr:hypothetical protein [Pontibacter sp. BT731]MDO6390128.1 hypothetical protein [Pontibacter sp. BT731]
MVSISYRFIIIGAGGRHAVNPALIVLELMGCAADHRLFGVKLLDFFFAFGAGGQHGQKGEEE